MIDDLTLARRLTDAVLAVPGVEAVFPVKPIVHLASEGVAAVLELDQPDVLVDVERTENLLTVTAHIATARARATPHTLGAAGEALREVALREGAVRKGAVGEGALGEGALGDGALGDGVESDGVEAVEVMVFVKARLIAEAAGVGAGLPGAGLPGAGLPGAGLPGATAETPDAAPEHSPESSTARP